MVSKDILVVAGGVVIVAIALIGVFYYDGEDVESSGEWTVYTIHWRENTQELLLETGTILDQDAVTLSKTLNAYNVTEVKATVSWEDRYPGRLRDFTDILMMTITPPGGTSIEYFPGNPSNGTVAPLIITAALGEKPQDITINTTEWNTVSEILAENTSQNGMGNWAVTLDAEIKKPFWVVLKNRGDEYTVTITYKYYWAEVTTTGSP